MSKQHKPFLVIRRKTKKVVGRFVNRKDAVYWCKVNQSLPLPDYEWEDEFAIRRRVYSKRGTIVLLNN